jgi:hypothetical protein
VRERDSGPNGSRGRVDGFYAGELDRSTISGALTGIFPVGALADDDERSPRRSGLTPSLPSNDVTRDQRTLELDATSAPSLPAPHLNPDSG